MARERQGTQSSTATGGLLSGVFSFVSREIESFVTSATGGEIQNHDHRRPSNSKGEVGGEDRARVIDGDAEVRGRRNEDRRRTSDHSDTRETLTSSRRDRSKNHIQQNRTPSPPQLYPPQRQRRQSMSMPGSLFPRSPSLLPDLLPRCADEGDERRVRFACENEAGPSRPRDIPRPRTSFEKPVSVSHSSTTSVSPLDRRGVPSVRDAVKKFRAGENDADPSILLPRETVSPCKGKEKVGDEVPIPSPKRSREDKGKKRAQERDGSDHEYDYAHSAETTSEVRVRGKERELAEAREEQMRRERSWEWEWERYRERDRDNEFVVDEKSERERGRDKERIKMLEDEIRMLKEELSKRPINNSAPLPAPPPPPPPPPLPSGSMLPSRTSSNSKISAAQDALFASARAALKHTAQPVELPINFSGMGARVKRTGQPTVNIAGEKMAAFLMEMKNVRLRKVGGGGSAGDREAGMGSGVNDLARSWSTAGRPRSLDADRHRMAEPTSGLTRHGLPSFRSFGTRTEDSRAGEKRKRYGESEVLDEIQNAAKRRVVWSSFVSTSTIPKQTTTSNSSSGMNPPSSSLSTIPHLNSHPHPANRTWPSIPTETDLMTPELCSDNEGERGDSSLDERYRLPSTPPVSRGGENPVQVKENWRVETDVDTDFYACAPQAAASPRIRKDSELFSKRLPTTPMLLDTPRKPRPPARPMGRTTPKSVSKSTRQGEEDVDDDDPLTLLFSSPDVVALSSLRPKQAATDIGKKNNRCTSSGEASREYKEPAPLPISAQNGSTNISRSNRRLTLDQEMRDAHARSLLRDDEDLDLHDLDGGTLMGVGTRSKKRGFLAHGGAGGLPVFMGDGYVDGVEGSEDEERDDVGGDRDDDEDYEPSRKKGSGERGRRGPAAAPATIVKRKNRR